MDVTRTRARQATAADHVLAESPVWDATRSRLLWVDIPAGAVLEGRLEGGRIRETGRWALDETVGAVALAEDGGLLVAGRHALHTLDAAGAWHRGPALITGPRRFNDGACDPRGRFVVGSLALDGDPGPQQLLTHLGGDRYAVLRSEVGLSNGIDWSADGTTIFHVDSEARTVSRAAYDLDSGRATGWTTLFEVPDGTPDGLAVDAAGDLWLAVWGAGEVRRYTHDGTPTCIVEVDAPLTSSLAFAGPDLDTLVITTARDGLTPAELDRFPASGSLFTCTVDATGRLPARWRGSLQGG
jgi:sugar lactone lactonase YvrE